MNVLQIKIHEDGTLDCSPDFKIIRGGYRNILMNVEVPHSLLLDPIKDEASNKDVSGNFVRVAAIIRTVVGKNLQTKKYEFDAVQDYECNGTMYRLYQRIMPKEFTLWETISQSEATGRGLLQLIFNVVNWTKLEGETQLQDTKIEQITASPILKLDVYPGAYLEDIEAIENPADYEVIKGRMDDLEIGLNKVNDDIDALENKDKEIDVDIQALQEKDRNIDEAIQALQDKDKSIDESIDMLQNRDNEIHEDIQALQNKDIDIDEKIAALRNDVNTISTSGNIVKTAEEWENENPILANGQFGYDKTNNYTKIGDGTSSWNELVSFATKDEIAEVVQETGQSETQIMSQKATTDELDKKLDKTGGEIAGDLAIDGVLYANNVDISSSYRANSIELSGAVDTPFIDWHFKNSEDDYNIRMIMNAKDRIDITGGAVNFEKIMINNNDLFSIGSILMFADETEPAKLYGGTWEKIVDRFLLGAGGKYGLGATGGSENAVVVAHRHNEIQYVNNSAWSIGDTLGLGGTQTRPYSTKIGNVSQTTGAKSHYCTSWDGESGTDKNMPPYLAVNIWKRIA